MKSKHFLLLLLFYSYFVMIFFKGETIDRETIKYGDFLKDLSSFDYF